MEIFKKKKKKTVNGQKKWRGSYETRNKLTFVYGLTLLRVIIIQAIACVVYFCLAYR